ncbi:MAG TPA: sugar ABC transporter substrate-binding protein [Alphaproteobacteria bacterium]|nr:sugar ABC transporter substrate-binding protein [Alphaproteobacteria bacterium]
MKKLSIVISLPGENNYLREQESAAKTTAQRLGLDLRIINAKSDPVTQSQQLLEIVQATSTRPDAIVVEPVNNQGLPRVAEAAVAAGIGWVVSNALVDYLEALRKDAKAPVFGVSQDHPEVGRMQGRQIRAILPRGGAILYLRGPATNFLAAQRSDALESELGINIQFKSLKIQWTEESAYNSVTSWLRLSTVRAGDTQLIAAQNTDFILAAKRAFEDNTSGDERKKWLGLPYCGVTVPSQVKQLVDSGTLTAAIVTSVTLDTAIELLVRHLQTRSQPRQQTFIKAWSEPSLDELIKKYG